MAGSEPTAAYVQHGRVLRSVLEDLTECGPPILPSRLDAVLGAQSAEALRELVHLDYRRKVGAFFTTGQLRDRITEVVANLPGRTIVDPTCGAGDLLIAAADRLPVLSSLADTLAIWETQLFGLDLHSEFVEAARIRLTLKAVQCIQQAGLEVSFDLPDNYVPFAESITKADFRMQLQGSRASDIVVLNPPYTRMRAPADCSWAGGGTSTAAVFFLEALDLLSSGGHIVAILPDSLRSGSLFAKWRARVEAQTDVLLVQRLGIFDQYADIDVFLLVARVGKSIESVGPAAWWDFGSLVPSGSATLGELFEVRVGAVVDNRDPIEGEEYPFLVARDLPSGGTMNTPNRRRKFLGRVFTPPFVVLRRTSRPSPPGIARANGVIVTGRQQVAVDNHLLVASPHSGGMEQCRSLLKVLADPRISLVLDERISCRHLTVGAVKELPWLV